MYWPQNVATRLLEPTLPHVASSEGEQPDPRLAADGSDLDVGVHLSPSHPASNPSHFILLSRDTLHVYSARPALALATLRRTPRSLEEYGHNRKAWWRPQWDGRHADIAVETTASYILVYTIRPAAPPQLYAYRGDSSDSKTPYTPSSKSLRNHFAVGSGEAGVSWAASNNELRIDDAGTSSRPVRNSSAIQITLRLALRIDAGLASCLPTGTHILVSTIDPPALQSIPWPSEPLKGSEENGADAKSGHSRTLLLETLPWLDRKHIVVSSDASEPASGFERQQDTHVASLAYSRAMDLYVWLASDGRAYLVTKQGGQLSDTWKGRCFHGAAKRRRSSARPVHRGSLDDVIGDAVTDIKAVEHGLDGQAARCTCINAKMGLVAIGQRDGAIAVYFLRSQSKAVRSHVLSLRSSLRSTSSGLTTGAAQTLQWTADGLALAVGWEHGWAVWSAWGKLMGHSFVDDHLGSRSRNFADTFMSGVQHLFWGAGGSELFVLAGHRPSVTGGIKRPSQLFVIPHAKSAVAGQHSPDNTRFAFIQLDDALLVYRGSDQPDMSIINPDSDVWQYIKIPQQYLAFNWPIRIACISSDGLLIAVSGRRGLAHYSATSGRWKTFTHAAQEAAFVVRGGMQWFEHVLIVACQPVDPSDGSVMEDEAQLRLYSRDADLVESNLLHLEKLPGPIVLTSLFEDSLLVYTADNTLYHYLIIVTRDEISLQLCGSITFGGVVGEPERVRGLSWMIPKSQQQLGDPMDDLTVATIIFLVDGKLVLLRPRKNGASADRANGTGQHPDDSTAAAEEVAYDMQILGDKIEYYWTHLSGIGTLENSLWGYDGSGIKLWLDALTIEHAEPRHAVGDSSSEDGSDEEIDPDFDEDDLPEYKTIEESLSMPLDFYPLCVVLEKGIIVGVEPEVSIRKNLDFAVFRAGTATHLFLDRLLRHHLEHGTTGRAVVCANSYRQLVYFAHALEILLHAVLEDEADAAAQLESADNGKGFHDKPVAPALTASASWGTAIEHSLSTSSSNASNLSTHTVDAPEDLITRTANSQVGRSAVTGGGIPTGAGSPMLPLVIDFLDHFDECLSVIVNCARKTEIVRWAYLFDHLGPGVSPRTLFETCLQRGDFRTAGSYLLVLHTLHGGERQDRKDLDGASDSNEQLTARLIRMILAGGGSSNPARSGEARSIDWSLCRDLLRYTRSMDDSGRSLKTVVDLAGLLDDSGNGQSGQMFAALEERLPSRSTEAAGTPTRPRRTSRQASSTSSVTLDTPQEEDEDEELSSNSGDGMSMQSSNGRHFGQSRNASTSSRPPVPMVSVNGRILPSPVIDPASFSPAFMSRTPSNGEPRASSPLSPSQESNGIKGTSPSGQSASPASSAAASASASSRPFSMSPPGSAMRSSSASSLHHVGLRSSLSTDHLFRGSATSPPGSNGTLSDAYIASRKSSDRGDGRVDYAGASTGPGAVDVDAVVNEEQKDGKEEEGGGGEGESGDTSPSGDSTDREADDDVV
ncbi:unnamed protein product [Parajaminaea phylloscopi]